MTATRTATTPHPIYLAGRWVESDDPLVIENPARPDEPAGSTFHATPAQYEEAVEAAVARVRGHPQAAGLRARADPARGQRGPQEPARGAGRDDRGRGGQADPRRPRRGRPGDAHLPARRRGGGADDRRADPARPHAGVARTGSGSRAASRSGRSRASARSTSRSTSPRTRSRRRSPRATRSSSSRRPRTRW